MEKALVTELGARRRAENRWWRDVWRGVVVSMVLAAVGVLLGEWSREDYV